MINDMCGVHYFNFKSHTCCTILREMMKAYQRCLPCVDSEQLQAFEILFRERQTGLVVINIQ